MIRAYDHQAAISRVTGMRTDQPVNILTVRPRLVCNQLEADLGRPDSDKILERAIGPVN